MARTRSRRKHRKARAKLLGIGVSSLVTGIALLVAPAFMGSSAVRSAIASGTRMPAVMALVLGAAFIALHTVLARLSAQHIPSGYNSKSTSWAPPDVLNRVEPGFADAYVPASIVRSRGAPVEPASAASQGRQETTWSRKVLQQIEWRRFEALCETLFAQGGFQTRAQSHGPDGGVDIWLHSKNAEGAAAVVQCKHWTGKPVGAKEMRAFFGVMASHRLKRGTFATTSTFTADAQQFAKDNGINAMDGERLLALIGKRTPQQQAELLAVAYEGEYWRPTCASCGVKMVERESKATAARFWGCPAFPKCRSTLPMRSADV
jgi:restriction system protein